MGQNPSAQPQLFDEAAPSSAAGRRLFTFEECSRAINQLYEAAAREKGSEAFLEFIEFVARFQNLSVFNAMLVRVQRPGAMAVAARRKWEALGGRVDPDAIPIMTLQPFGPVQFVFDIADVSGIKARDECMRAIGAAGHLDVQDLRAHKVPGFRALHSG